MIQPCTMGAMPCAAKPSFPPAPATPLGMFTKTPRKTEMEWTAK